MGTGELRPLVDRGTLAKLGLTRTTIDHLFEKLPVVRMPGQRKCYLFESDVKDYIDTHVYDGRTNGTAALSPAPPERSDTDPLPLRAHGDRDGEGADRRPNR